MTTPDTDAGPLVEIEQALAVLKTAILQYFESNPIDDEHRQIDDKDALHTQVLARIQEQSDLAAQAADAHAALGSKGRQAASPRAAGGIHPQSHPQAHPQTHPTSAPHTGAANAHPAATATGSAKGQEDPALSGAHWAVRCPSLGNDIKHLDADFGPRVARFIAAMEDAGIKVDVVGARRSPERAYLMHWSYKIVKEGTPATEADRDKNRPQGVADIRWAHTDEHGAYDPAASVRAAAALYRGLGVSATLGVPPSLTSNHIAGKAVDMTTTWHTDSITIRKDDGSEVVIRTTGASERDDNNPRLHEVGESYGVIHFASEKGAKTLPAGDRNHWSYNGH